MTQPTMSKHWRK